MVRATSRSPWSSPPRVQRQARLRSQAPSRRRAGSPGAARPSPPSRSSSSPSASLPLPRVSSSAGAESSPSKDAVDRLLLLAARGLRAFGFGFSAVLIGVYLERRGLPPGLIGLTLGIGLAAASLSGLPAPPWRGGGGGGGSSPQPVS